MGLSSPFSKKFFLDPKESPSRYGFLGTCVSAGQYKMEKYGNEFLKLINGHLARERLDLEQNKI